MNPPSGGGGGARYGLLAHSLTVYTTDLSYDTKYTLCNKNKIGYELIMF